MSNLRQARRASVAAIGLGFGLLICLGTTAARESGLSPFETGAAPFKTLEFQMASLAPFEAPQEKPVYRLAEPFGMGISALVKGGVQQKWSGVKKKLPREARMLARCRTNADACTPAAKRFLAVIDKAAAREGWTRIAELNRAINLTIKSVDDMTQYGVRDLWASPLMTFSSGAGDCEDYAIAKYVALHEIGFRDEDLRLVIVHDRAAKEDHAVTAVRYDNRWLILDNKTLDIRQDDSVAQFDPLFVIDSEGVKRAEARAPKPQNPWADASIIAGEPASSGWQSSAPLLL
jgi:predicted transglutaminase-like cysteine proteinase